MRSQRGQGDFAVIFGIVMAIIVVGALLFFGLPIWNVWRASLSGESELKQAQWNRQIAVSEAEAKALAAVKLAEAEVARAQGVAQANKIIGESLKQNEAYLRYLWVQSLDHAKSTVVYIPTEANLPILEATRHVQP